MSLRPDSQPFPLHDDREDLKKDVSITDDLTLESSTDDEDEFEETDFAKIEEEIRLQRVAQAEKLLKVSRAVDGDSHPLSQEEAESICSDQWMDEYVQMFLTFNTLELFRAARWWVNASWTEPGFPMQKSDKDSSESTSQNSSTQEPELSIQEQILQSGNWEYSEHAASGPINSSFLRWLKDLRDSWANAKGPYIRVQVRGLQPRNQIKDINQHTWY